MAVVLTSEGGSLQRQRVSRGNCREMSGGMDVAAASFAVRFFPKRRGARHDPAAFARKVRWSNASSCFGTATTHADDASDSTATASASSHIDAEYQCCCRGGRRRSAVEPSATAVSRYRGHARCVGLPRRHRRRCRWAHSLGASAILRTALACVGGQGHRRSQCSRSARDHAAVRDWLDSACGCPCGGSLVIGRSRQGEQCRNTRAPAERCERAKRQGYQTRHTRSPQGSTEGEAARLAAPLFKGACAARGQQKEAEGQTADNEEAASTVSSFLRRHD